MDAHLSIWGTVFIEVSRFSSYLLMVGICVSFEPVVSIALFLLFRQSPKSWVNHQKVKIVYVFNNQKSWVNHHGFNHEILHLKGTCSSSGLSLDSQMGILETSPETEVDRSRTFSWNDGNDGNVASVRVI